MPGEYGAVFGKAEAPSIRDLFIQNEQTRRFEKKQEIREAEIKKKEDAKSEVILNKTWDPSKVATGTPMDKMITDYMLTKRNEYAKIQKETGMSSAELMGMMQQDFMPVGQYLQNSKDFNLKMQKVRTELEKQGFKGSELDRLVREKIFFNKDEAGNLTPKKFEDIDFDIEGAISDIKENSVDGLTISQDIAFKDLKNRPKTVVAGEFNFSNTPNAGVIKKTRDKGSAKFDPLFFDVRQDEKTGVVTDVFPKTRDFYGSDGELYVDKKTGKPAEPVLADEAFDYIYNGGNEARKLLIDQRANKRIADLRAAGKSVDETDKEYFRREEALNIIQNNAGNELKDSKSRVFGYRRPERPRTATTSKLPDVVNLEIAPKTANGNFDITGQIGQINVGRNQKSGKADYLDGVEYNPANDTYYIKYTPKNKYGSADGAQVVKPLSSDAFKNLLKANRNLPGNKKAAERILPGPAETKKADPPAPPTPKKAEPKKDKAATNDKKPPSAPKKFKGTKNKMY